MKMQQVNINEYFDFFNDDDIRIKGTRVGIETVLDDYLNATSPEEIAVRYPVLTLEQVYATITFYLRNQNEIEQYINRWREYAEKAWLQQKQNPSPAIQRLIKLKSQRSQQNNRTNT
ncbi:MAG: hypothetical protein OMM_12487 [Candidatus Magnetoglobus multicellularis str. Araruama]|uniref:DUF433 domain-containing protein n=1 Tax=Candidatus Magnetoglobus multicellularis str. Araruama TaxID=890399 RepID=A0A1V1NVP8_9BACT|nr:MAG: hypothetical protein OMM_12487 [Candidatus Magnetoglobus multicellularis str. Araruama]